MRVRSTIVDVGWTNTLWTIVAAVTLYGGEQSSRVGSQKVRQLKESQPKGCCGNSSQKTRCWVWTFEKINWSGESNHIDWINSTVFFSEFGFLILVGINWGLHYQVHGWVVFHRLWICPRLRLSNYVIKHWVSCCHFWVVTLNAKINCSGFAASYGLLKLGKT